MLNASALAPALNGSIYSDDTGGGDADGSSVSPATTMTAQSIVLITIMALFSVLGTVGNALAFLIYYRKREKGTSTIFILALAVTDFFTCMIVIPYSIAYELLEYKLHYDVICRLYHFVITCNIPLSSLILVAIGFDRYFCICHPFLHAITVPRTKVIIIVLALLSALLGVVPASMHSVYGNQIKTINVSVPLSQLTASGAGGGHSPSSSSSFPSSSYAGDDISASLDSALSLAPDVFNIGLNPTQDTPGDDSTRVYTDGLYVKPDRDFLDEYNNNNHAATGHSVSYKTATGSDGNDNDAGDSDDDDGGDGGGTLTAELGSIGPTSPAIPASAASEDDDNDDNTRLTQEDKGQGLGNKTSSAMVVVQKNETVLVYNPLCRPTFRTISIAFFQPYQRAYASLFLVEFIILAFLYALIYRSIFNRRAWKAKRRQKSGYAAAAAATTDCHETEETQLTNINGHNAIDATSTANATNPAPKKTQGRISAAMRDRTLYANIRTAAMLFVVTVVFVVSFLPSWLMGLQAAPFNLIVFYIFYVNNVINPFIYAFMNKSFRDDLVQLIKNCVRR